MKQALHIFRKDARRLWPQIAVVAGLFVLYAVASRGDVVSALAILVVMACWLLGANVIHEEALAEESPFWITRPYRRMSLFAAKVLFLFAFVFIPLVVSGIVLEARAGVNVAANAGTLLVLDLVVSTWLILPALAIGAVTKNLKAFAGTVGVLAAGYFAITAVVIRLLIPASLALARAPDVTNIAELLPVILAASGVVWLQYAARKTQWSRAALAIAVIGSAFLLPLNGVALWSVRATNPGFDPNGIHVSFDETVPPRMENGMGNGMVVSVALKVDGLPAGTILRAFGETDAEVSSVLAGTRPIRFTSLLGETNGGYRYFLWIPGPHTGDPESLHALLNFEVLSVTPIATIPARMGTFVAGNAGRCEILTPFPENTQLRCDVERPVVGSIGAGLEYPGYEVYSDSFFRSRDPASLSPVKWEKFDGESAATPGGWPFDEAMSHPGAHFVLRTERVIGFVRSDLVYHALKAVSQ